MVWELNILDTSIFVQGHMLDFKELVSLCLQEEVKLGKSGGASISRSTRYQVFYSQGRGFNRGSQTFSGGQSYQNAQQKNKHEFGNQRGRGRFVPRGGRRGGRFEETSNVTIMAHMVTWQTNVCIIQVHVEEAVELEVKDITLAIMVEEICHKIMMNLRVICLPWST